MCKSISGASIDIPSVEILSIGDGWVGKGHGTVTGSSHVVFYLLLARLWKGGAILIPPLQTRPSGVEETPMVV